MTEVVKAEEIQYYSHLEKVLKRTQLQKAEKFLELNCIQYDMNRKVFLCLPIKGYNTRTYLLEKLEPPRFYEVDGEQRKISFECNCQYAQKCKREGLPPWCSHLFALHLWFDRRNKERNWGRWKK